MMSHSLSVRAYRMIEVAFRSLNHNPTIVSNARRDVRNRRYSRLFLPPPKEGISDPTETIWTNEKAIQVNRFSNVWSGIIYAASAVPLPRHTIKHMPASAVVSLHSAG